MADKSKFIEYIHDALEKSKETALSHLFFTYQGIPYPVTMCTSETFQALDAFEARSDDIVIASYPKCGSNWILHIVSELIFAVSKKKYTCPEFPVLECGDTEKYQNLLAGIKQISEFLGFSLTDEQIRAVSDQSTFQAMRENSQETHGAIGPFLFRKGEVGDWKNLFNETQNQEMDERFKECLAGTSLGVKLKYESHCLA
ncbi:Sulfotransferase 6B1 [Cricetulus griseus]|uniref:Sulfotransferase n=1 Tax=Cricetulus griseus TaxID=10029 RepID=G3HX96_CRIGR|nr:Sulfotransferase 6B1 [Cricetulus griseus]ERE68139.1 sulfotransferase 6B1-like protein [Cricetulus griseus]